MKNPWPPAALPVVTDEFFVQKIPAAHLQKWAAAVRFFNRTMRAWGALTPTSAGHKFIFGGRGETCSWQVLAAE